MKEKMRRLLSLLLVVTLAFSMVPATLAATPFNVTTAHLFTGAETLLTSKAEMENKIQITGWPPEGVEIGKTYEVSLKADGVTEDGAPYVMDGTQKFVLQSIKLKYSLNDKYRDEVKWTSAENSEVNFSVTTKEPQKAYNTVQDYAKRNKNELSFEWELDQSTAVQLVTIRYDFNLPEGAHAYHVTKEAGVLYASYAENYINNDTLNKLKNTGIQAVVGNEIPYYPDGALTVGEVSLIGGVPTTTNGNLIRKYYSFDGWKIADDATLYTADDATLYTEDNMPEAEAEKEITFTAQWTEITDAMLDERLTDERKALEVPFATTQETGTDAMIAQQSSTSKSWSTESSKKDALELEDDRKVYYKANLSMNPLIAEVNILDIFHRDILANRKITDPTFASFDIKVQLDEQLEAVADNNGYVTFKFTCTFLQPAGTAESGSNVAVIKDEDGENIYTGTYNEDGNSYVYTVPASTLNAHKIFSIPMEWKPTETGYSADELTDEISLEVAATKVSGDKEAWVKTTGVITGNVDLSKAGVQETDVVSYIIASDAEWKAAFKSDDMTYLDILAAAKQMKNAMSYITLDANTVWAHVDGPEPEPIEPDWETSKSKTATNLDENFESKVTLSLPAAEEQPSTDVVFVLDRSDSSKNARDEINEMLTELADIVEESAATIKVGVVNFSYQADKKLELTELTKDNLEEIEQVITNDKISGTNIEAGIEAGVKMLEADTETAEGNKYLVLLTDGISHAWNGADGQVMTVWGEGTADTKVVFNGANSYVSFDSVKSSFKDIYAMEADNEQLNSPYEVPVYGDDGTVIGLMDEQYQTVIKDAEKYIKETEYDKYLSGTEKGIYTAAHAYADAAEKYKCISLYWTNNDYSVAKEFMEWTATQGKAYDITDSAELDNVFDSVQKDILYVVDKGSTVEDYMGNGKDEKGNDYNFDFVADPEKLILKVGNTTYVTKTAEANKETALYYFVPSADENTEIKNAPFVLHYYEDSSNTKLDEHFVWDINVPIQVTDTVSLTYSVKLRRPATEDGTYGQYDADGSEKYEGLYTNNSATLYPIDSNGNKVKEEEFKKPTVSYMVSTKPVGTLHISKYVADENAVVGQLYTFEVTVGDETETVTLKDGETKKWPNLPMGTEYSIEETDSQGYKATYYNQEGTITKNDPDVVAAVVNVPANEGALVISKTVNGNDQDLDKAFKFTITLDQDVGEVSYSGSDSGKMTFMEVEEGKYIASAALANGQTISINNLPAGVRYTVEEAAEDGYTTTISGHDAAEPYEGAEAEGTIVKGSAAVVHFTNTYHKQPVDPPTPPTPSEKYDIDVAKSVDDSRPEVGDTVTYTVKIKNTGDKKLTDIKVEDVMKKAAGSIKVDENKLPSGVKYEGDGEFTIDELAASKTITIKYTYKVKSADEDETIKNTVTAKANGVSDSDDASIRVRDDDDDDDDDDRPSKSSKSSKPKLDTEDHYAYIVGMPDGLVHPEAEITRAEVATIFYRLLTEESRKALWTKENPYSDVAPNDWYNVAVSVMSNGGVIHGYPDGTFKGGSSITRAEFATIAAQFLSSKYAGSDRFTDISGHWAAEYINRAAAEGWIAGYPDGTFRPNQNITRAEAMTLVNAVLGRTPDKDHLLRNMIEWPDNMVESKWYYAQVQEATNSHEYERGSKKTAEDWTKLLEVRDWLEIERVWSDIYSSHNPGEVMAD